MLCYKNDSLLDNNGNNNSAPNVQFGANPIPDEIFETNKERTFSKDTSNS
jgi:hypothetical protein